MTQVTLRAGSSLFALPNQHEPSEEKGDSWKQFVAYNNAMFTELYGLIGGSPTHHVTLRGPANDSYPPNTREFTVEHGDSYRTVISQIDAMLSEIYTITGGTTSQKVTLKAPAYDYYLPNTRDFTPEHGDAFRTHCVQINAMMTECYVNAGGVVADTTPPTLSSPTATDINDVSASGSVSSNEGNGILYWVITTSPTNPTANQVKTGKNELNASAVLNSSQSVSTTGVQPTISFTGLTASTVYYAHYMQEDAALNPSAVVATASFTTAASGATLVTPVATLDSAYDTGFSSSDLITNSTTPHFTVRFFDLVAGDIIDIKKNGTLQTPHTVNSGEEGGTDVALTLSALTEGAWSLEFKQTRGLSFSAYSTPLSIQVYTTNPTLSSTSPADNATTFVGSSNLTATFNRNVKFGTGNFTIKKSSDDSTIEAFDVATEVGTGNGQISVSGAVVTMNPTGSLVDGTDYYVVIDATAIDDEAGNSFAGISSKTVWNFTAADVVNPTLVSTSPVDNATGIVASANLTATFSENIAFGGTVSISVKKTSDNSHITGSPFTATDIGGAISISTNVLTINPASDLAASTEYYVLITSGSITDISGNPYAGISSTTAWSFTISSGSFSTPADFGSALRFWYKSTAGVAGGATTGAEVTGLADQSGNGFDLTKVAYGGPLMDKAVSIFNNKDVLTFAGLFGNTALVSARDVGFNLGVQRTFFFIGYMDSGSASSFPCFADTLTAAQAAGSQTGGGNSYFGGTASHVLNPGDADWTYFSPRLLALVFDGAHVTAYSWSTSGGLTQTATPAVNTSDEGATGNLCIGDFMNSSSGTILFPRTLPWAGKLAEFFGVNTAVNIASGPEWAALKTYANAQYHV